jgi:phosphomannomutase
MTKIDLAPCLSFDTTWDSMPARIVVFDLDDTLAPSKSPIPPPIADGLGQLLDRADVAIISGGRFEQFSTQVIERLSVSSKSLAKLHLMPTCGTRYYRWADESWRLVYSEDLSSADIELITNVLISVASALGLSSSETWGDVIEDRGSQVTFSALGQRAPVSAKSTWDPDGVKKTALRAYAAERLPGFEVRSGGSTSIDVTRKGIDKAYGIHKLLAYTHASMNDLLFVGDRLDPDGNDFPVRRLGVRCVEVTSWKQTESLLRTLNHLPEGCPLTDVTTPGVAQL